MILGLINNAPGQGHREQTKKALQKNKQKTVSKIRNEKKDTVPFIDKIVV